MDHNLEDSLNLEGAMDSMDFDSSEVVVSQEDITLETSGHEEDIAMEFEEQQILMDTGTEEIIVTDFMGDQFTLQEYDVQDVDQTVDSNVAVELNPLGAITSSSETLIDLQLDPETVQQSTRPSTTAQPKYISVKAPVSTRMLKKVEPAAIPRQVAIAPKPPQLTPAQKTVFGKQFTIAPKPVALVINKSLKKVSLSGVQGTKGNTVLQGQINKQYVMVPTDGNQKIKLVSSRPGATLQCVPSSSEHAQLIPNPSINATQITKPVMGKVIVQGQSNPESGNQSAVIRKLVPTSTAPTHTRYVMQHKSMPIYIGGNKVILTSPTKQAAKIPKQKNKHIISIKSVSPTRQGVKNKNIIAIPSSPQKIIPVTSQAMSTKKVVITTNPNNVILKTTAPPKGPTVSKDGNIVVQGQQTQLHQINVPGKGIQYIRLVTSSAPAPAGTHAPPAKSYLISDGNLIQMTADNIISSPPPLVIAGSVPAAVSSQQERKLVRIAPVTNKGGHSGASTVRSSQSLLAPVAPPADELELAQEQVEEEPAQEDDHILHQQTDDVIHTLAIKYENIQSPETEEIAQEVDSNDNNDELHPLIVIPPSTFRQLQTQYTENNTKENIMYSDEESRYLTEDANSLNNLVTVEADIGPYQSPHTPQALSDTDLVATDLGLRPRKACNCTKSQCLKLYCDCFANGEFCNECNCNNCRNNLEHEELRQKAIRACLERNPNAFRPKIGKAKSGGPEIIRQHNKGCNCKRSGCLKNYCECYEAKIACTPMCKCVGCRNVEETLERRRNLQLREKLADSNFRPTHMGLSNKQPCSFMTSEVIEAVCQCLVAAAGEAAGAGDAGDAGDGADAEPDDADPMRDVLDEFARCLQEIIAASHQQGQA